MRYTAPRPADAVASSSHLRLPVAESRQSIFRSRSAVTISHTLPTRGNEPVDRRRLDASVLVVDDDPGTRETFDWALRSCGVRVRTSASGADAIELAQTHTFDLLLLDLELRDMRGTDVIRVVRTPTVCVPFVLISAFLTTEVTVEAMRL